MQDYQNAGPGFFKILGVGLVALLLIGLITVGGYLGGWWLRSDQTNRQSNIDRQNFGTQLGYIKKVQSSATDVATIDVQIASVNAEQKAALQAQKKAIVTQGCNAASLIVNKPDDVATFVSVYCN